MKQLNKEKTLGASPVTEEALFNRLLSLECRRCERTGTPFALMLLGLNKLKDILSPSAMRAITSSLGGTMRETDVIGWYENASVIGIILTTLNGTERHIVESAVVRRVRTVLAESLNEDQLGAISIRFQIFPDENDWILHKKDSCCYRDQHQYGKTNYSAGLKRSIDVAGSLAALLVLSPLFAIIAALIKLTSQGPVFFKQKRVGQFGEEFTCFKFRSMYLNNDPAIHQEYIRNLINKKVEDSDGTFKIKNDPRVTPIGRLIRKISLDELPQFINVLKGDMSLVGPRPPIRYEVENYSLWHRRRIMEARPGITGEWQVYGRSRTTFDEMVRMDLHYIRNQSLRLDLKILLKTPFAALSGDGAY